MQASHPTDNAKTKQACPAALSLLTDVLHRRWVSQCVSCSNSSGTFQLQKTCRWVLFSGYHQCALQLVLSMLTAKYDQFIHMLLRFAFILCQEDA